MSVTQREIVTAIDTRRLETIEQIAAHTRAGTGCGTCRTDLAAILTAHSSRTDGPVLVPA